MSISVGGINLADSVLNLEFRLGVLERVMDRVAAHIPPGSITPAILESIRSEVIRDLQKKYPEAGIIKK